MKDSFDIVYNKELGCWEEKKEPYTTIEIATEKDFELLKQKQFYDKNYGETENYKKEIKKLKEQLAEYKKSIDKFIKDRNAQAVKEFAEKLKNKLFEFFQDNEELDGKISVGPLYVDVIGVEAKDGTIISLGLIDKLLKEYDK